MLLWQPCSLVTDLADQLDSGETLGSKVDFASHMSGPHYGVDEDPNDGIATLPTITDLGKPIRKIYAFC